MRRIISKEADIYIKEHFATETYKALAEKFGATERQMRGHINNMGWKKNRDINAHYFDQIDTPEKRIGSVSFMLMATSVFLIEPTRLLTASLEWN